MASLTQRLRGVISTALACLLIAFFTLLPQTGVPDGPFEYCIACGSFGSTNLLLNALLFMPLGVALRRLGASLALALTLALAATFLVEMLQLFAITGRHASLGDILANTAGGALGWTLAANWARIAHPTSQQGLVLSAVQSAMMVLLVVVGGWLFQSSPTTQRYYGQIAPVLRERGAVDGIVSGATLNGGPLPDGPMSQPDADAIRGRMHANDVSLGADLVLRSERQRPVLIVRIADSEEEEIALLGLRSTDAVFAVRTRATDFSFFQPSLVLPNAFRCDSCAGGIIRNRMSIGGRRHGATYQLSVSGDGSARTTSMDISANMTWMLFAPEIGNTAGRAAAVTTLWVFAQAVLLGYWLGLTNRRSRSTVIASIAIGSVAVAATTQLILPALMSTAFGTTREWGAIMVGALAGGAIAKLVNGSGAQAE